MLQCCKGSAVPRGDGICDGGGGPWRLHHVVMTLYWRKASRGKAMVGMVVHLVGKKCDVMLCWVKEWRPSRRRHQWGKGLKHLPQWVLGWPGELVGSHAINWGLLVLVMWIKSLWVWSIVVLGSVEIFNTLSVTYE